MNIKEINELEKKQQLGITAKEVLPDMDLQTSRYHKLLRAMQLWNQLHEKTKIVFKAGGKIIYMETPVWFVSEKHVCINAGVTILVSCILEVIT